ncbi:MAG: magnesium transporter, partial [Clostridia bacterium]|nr:magnesium transporter [Clostridia bacterium]
LLPLGAKALGLDPALTATPLITTMADTCSLLILFAIASAALL